jgi:hypothetical protein
VRDIADHPAPQLLVRGDRIGHRIERGGELRDLVAAAYLDVRR